MDCNGEIQQEIQNGREEQFCERRRLEKRVCDGTQHFVKRQVGTIQFPNCCQCNHHLYNVYRGECNKEETNAPGISFVKDVVALFLIVLLIGFFLGSM